MACGILDSAFDQSETKTQNLLLRQIREFGSKTILQIANSASTLEFLGHVCCQRLLNRIWYNEIDPDTNKVAISLATIFPFLAPFLLNYKRNSRLQLDLIESNFTDSYIRDLQPAAGAKSMEYESSSVLDGHFSSSKTRLFKKKKEKKDPDEKKEAKKPDKVQQLNYFEKFFYFFKTPLVKFVYSQVSI